MIFDCNYFLLQASLGRESNTVPKGYGMYFRLSLYLAEKLRYERVKFSSNKDMECIFRLDLSLIGGFAGEGVKYASTEIWNVF